MIKICISMTSHALDPLPLSQSVTPSRTPSPSSVTYFMDGPQSGLKSGGRGSGSNKFQLFQANFLKIYVFSCKFSKNFGFFRQFHNKFRFSRQKLVIYNYFWANYSISLKKSPLLNILPVHDKI